MFNSKLRDELLNRELFLHIDELKYVADRWRMDPLIIGHIAAWIIQPRQNLRRSALRQTPLQFTFLKARRIRVK